MNPFVDKDGWIKPITTALTVIVVLIGIVIGWFSWYITPEGHVNVVKRFSKAVTITGPGLQFKIPMIETVDTIEIRTRNLQASDLAAATSEQMPVVINASMNWTVRKSSVLELYRDYGSLEQFEARVIVPRFVAISKEIVSKFNAEETISKRDIVAANLKTALMESCKDLPIDISIINIENIALPVNYLKSIETKQTEKNLADAEVFKLQKQNLEAQRAVNTANAEADATRAKAKAEAEAIALKGQAEADAIRAKAHALKNNPLIVELTKAQGWNGQLPTTFMGDGQSVLMDIRSK